MNPNKYKFLVTGAHGQIGKGLIPKLISKFGSNSVISTDVKPTSDISGCNYIQLDVRDKIKYDEIVKSEGINYIVHLAGILSVLAEKKPILAKEVNVDSVFTSLDLAVKYSTKIFIPSTVIVYAGDHINRPYVNLDTVPEPRLLYGICKVFMEGLGNYYSNKHNLDFRCLRYSGVVSPFEYEYNGTVYYATEMFFKAVRERAYSVVLSPERKVPMSHLDDIIEGTIQILEAEKSKLSRRVYNIAGLSFSPQELANEIKKHIPEFKVEYKPQQHDYIAARMPHIMDDKESRADFGWNPKFNNLEILVKEMLDVAKRT